jgi:hypothetical protein
LRRISQPPSPSWFNPLVRYRSVAVSEYSGLSQKGVPVRRLILAACLVAAGCADQTDRDTLATLQQQCANGWQSSCPLAEQQAAVNHAEAMDNAGTAAGIILLLPLAILVGVLGGGDDDDDGDDDEVDSFGHHHHHHHPAPHWHH